MKSLGVKTLGCPDCQNSDLEHIGVALMDNGGIYLVGVCPDCRSLITCPMDRLEWQLRNQMGTEPRGN